jgi:dolichol-phosphate mannosyltransferase
MNFETPTNRMKASIVIPAFNESQNLGLLVDEIRQKVEKHLDVEIIVVDDNSSDGTYFTAKELGLKVIRHRECKGYLEAIKSGLTNSSFSNIVVFDASGIYDPNGIIESVKIIDKKQADVAISYPIYDSWLNKIGLIKLA